MSNQQSFMNKKVEFENIVKKCDNYIDYSDSDNEEEYLERQQSHMHLAEGSAARKVHVDNTVETSDFRAKKYHSKMQR
jgi:hypothetical protein